jgi:integrase
MPRLVNVTPKYRRHRASGQAVVTVSGKEHYLGPHGTKASKVEYDRLVGEWLAAGRPAIAASPLVELTISELALDFWKFAQVKFRKNGRDTRTAENFKPVLSLLKKRYGRTLAIDFGPLALKALQFAMIEARHSRRYINDNVHRIRRMFRWAVSEQRLPESVYSALLTVEGLAAGETKAKEPAPVTIVSDEIVDATLPHLPDVVAAMVQFQRLTGARPGEVCQLRPCDIDRTDAVWRFVPLEHKTQHHGKQRTIYIGPKAQEVLRPYLLRDSESHCFQPAESERKRKERRHETRVTPLSCGNKPSGRRMRGEREPGEAYDSYSYRRAIVRGCQLAFDMPRELRRIPADVDAVAKANLQARAAKWRAEHVWQPNQLRHNVATNVRKQFGLEGAQVVLGHSRADITQIYAERDDQKAAAIMKEVG